MFIKVHEQNFIEDQAEIHKAAIQRMRVRDRHKVALLQALDREFIVECPIPEVPRYEKKNRKRVPFKISNIFP